MRVVAAAAAVVVVVVAVVPRFLFHFNFVSSLRNRYSLSRFFNYYKIMKNNKNMRVAALLLLLVVANCK
jgi:hypothetical protein